MPRRIVSLVPSSTETLLALGADVAACTKFCEQPHLPHVGGTKNPDLDAIIAMTPDVVVMDREENRREDAEALEAAGLRVHVSAVCSVGDALQVVADLADVAGLSRAAHAPLPEVELPGRRVNDGSRTAFVPIWRRPWMSINERTYAGSLLDHLGWSLVTAGSPANYPVVELDDIAALRPDAVLVPSEPYAFEERHLDELRAALPHALVRRIDGQDLFWWGSRTPAAMRRLGDQLTATQM
jgi:ABC-type Fe3+-hydroxamate transport system substrate-binding protein